jgi:hypothetical protein
VRSEVHGLSLCDQWAHHTTPALITDHGLIRRRVTTANVEQR